MDPRRCWNDTPQREELAAIAKDGAAVVKVSDLVQSPAYRRSLRFAAR
jgi:hypothetical protein